MNETIVSRWNELVRPRDHGYLIGDVAMKKSHLSILDRLNGHLRLVGGNHDIFTVADYRKYFNKIYGVRVFDDLLITHVPVHPTCLGKRFIVNVHGHIHARRLPGPYIGISVEQTDYRPLSLEDLRTRAEAFK
jgi:calcineurin-like phosphoesterase family protein